MRSLFHLANYAPERKNSLGRLCSYPHETARSHNFDSEIGGEKIKIQSRGAMVSCRRMPQILNAKEYT